MSFKTPMQFNCHHVDSDKRLYEAIYTAVIPRGKVNDHTILQIPVRYHTKIPVRYHTKIPVRYHTIELL